MAAIVASEVHKMKTRIISGVIFTALMALLFFFVPAIVTAITVAAICAIASWELLHTTGLVKSLWLNICSALMAVLVVLWCYLGGGYAAMLVGVLGYEAVLFGHMLYTGGKTPVAQMGYCLLSGLVLPFLLSALLRLRVMPQGRALLLIPFIMAYCSDTGAYFIGVCFGKHKMCPIISPKKSWEGFFGGIAVAVLVMLAYAFVLTRTTDLQVSFVLALVYGFVGALGSVFGDLMMSVIKRQVGIKDYGKLIPGHGGILDRFDSVLITAPLTEALLLLIPMVV
jgi:phosphatidate cytidylyltransferase